jgi:uncharacterized protein
MQSDSPSRYQVCLLSLRGVDAPFGNRVLRVLVRVQDPSNRCRWFGPHISGVANPQAGLGHGRVRKETMSANIEIPDDEIAEFCRRNHIRRLALFGSVLRDDFGPDSDVDVLVEFKPEAQVGLFELFDMEQELSHILGRQVDMNTPNSLSRYFRDQVLQEAEEQYVQA